MEVTGVCSQLRYLSLGVTDAVLKADGTITVKGERTIAVIKGLRK